MRAKRFSGWVALLAATALAGMLSAAAGAERLAWDQAAVTAKAGDLVEAIEALRLAEKKQPTNLVATQQRAHARYLQTLKGLEQSSKQLHRRLQQGEGREATMPVAKKLRSLVRDAREDGSKFMTTETSLAVIEPAEAALAALGPYYFEPEPEPASP